MRSEIVVAAIFFLLLFLLRIGVDMWITFAISVTWPRDRIEQEAEAFDPMGPLEARPVDFPCLLFAWSTVKTEHYLGHNSGLCKHGRVATSLIRRSLS